jgi:hypothetical protein
MSATFFVFSPLSPEELRAVEAACTSTIEAYLEEHPDCDDEWGELGPGGALPTQPEVASAYRRFRLDLPDEIVETLSRCRSSLAIDRPGDLTTERLQVSALRMLLQRAGDALVMLNDYPLLPAREVLADLKRRKGAPGFGLDAPAPKPPKPVKRRDARPGEVRALRILAVLERSMRDRDLALDVRAALGRVPDLAQRYAALLLEEGARDDAKSAKALGVDLDVLDAAAQALDAALRF